MDADGKGKSVLAQPVDGFLLGGFDQHSTQCGRRRKISGTSTMRGRLRSKTGSARSIGRKTGIAAERGNSITLADCSRGALQDMGTGFAPGSSPKSAAMFAELRRGLAPRLRRDLDLSGTQSLARLALSLAQLPRMQLGASGRDHFREHQKAGAAKDSAATGACAARDSIRGERPPRRARNRRSDRYRHSRSVPRPQLQRQRWRRNDLERRVRRRSDSSSIRSSSVRLSLIRWS